LPLHLSHQRYLWQLNMKELGLRMFSDSRVQDQQHYHGKSCCVSAERPHSGESYLNEKSWMSGGCFHKSNFKQQYHWQKESLCARSGFWEWSWLLLAHQCKFIESKSVKKRDRNTWFIWLIHSITTSWHCSLCLMSLLVNHFWPRI
jgi:hypothetical protein